MVKQRYILALDQGTTSSRAILFDKKGNAAATAQAEYAQIYPREGWVEHDPLAIYSSVVAVASEALARLGLNRGDVAAIGITNQRETTVVWDKNTGMPVCNAIVWQCRRTADRCDALKAAGKADMIYRKTGLPIDPYFSATKLAWILDNVPNARARAEHGELLFGTVDTYLMWKLSAGKIFATDYTNASRTMLFNIHSLDWDNELLDLFGVPRSMLPRVQPSGSFFGYTDDGIFGARAPIAGVAGDQQAALFGHRCFERGTSKCTFGTGCFMLTNTGDEAVESKSGLITTLAAGVTNKPQYALEGSVFVGGAVVQWLRDELRIVRTAAETEEYAEKVSDTLGMYIVPAFVGLGAPYWDAYARGTITGITRGVTRNHFVRAALESIAYQVNDVLVAMEKDCDMNISRIAVDGGAAANNFLMKFTADITGCEAVRPAVVESTALGAAYLAGLTAGVYDMQGLQRPREGDVIFTPSMKDDVRARLLDGWADAVARTRTTARKQLPLRKLKT
ncbi:MAG: glycerol kinase GlpK [Clostridiales bacterium]|nr:glycerol kinase GlpK [Clostridiales bacterium]